MKGKRYDDWKSRNSINIYQQVEALDDYSPDTTITLFIEKEHTKSDRTYNKIFDVFRSIAAPDFNARIVVVNNGLIEYEHLKKNKSKFYITTSSIAEKSLATIRDSDQVFVILFEKQLADNKKTLFNAVTEITATYNSFYVRYIDDDLHNNYMESCVTMLAKNIDDVNSWYLNDDNVKYLKEQTK